MLVIAHRGSSQAAPENTLPAIQKAIRDGADAIEIDVQLTKDDHVVVCHDEWLNRTTNGNGFICDKSYAEIRKLDAGSWFHHKYKGTKVPQLEEVLALAKTSSIELHIELKNNLMPYPRLEEKVIQLIQKDQLDHQVVISSFRRDSLEKCMQLAPHIRRGLLCWSTLEWLQPYQEWVDLRLYSIHPHISLLTSQISDIQEQGVLFFPYVIERKQQLRYCLQHKVDGLFTNCPGRVKQLLKKR